MTEPPPFAPLRRRNSLGADIAARLQAMIQGGTYKPGDLLPGQRELAGRFGASLASVREAISVLTAAGLVEAHPGRGTTVRSVGDALPAFDGWLGAARDAQETQELLDARTMLEHFTVAQAAQRSTPEGLVRLDAALASMRAHLHDLERYVEADMQFHLAIAEVAGNRVVSRLMRVIQRPLFTQLRGHIERLQALGHLERNLEHHERIAEGIRTHDPALALRGFDDMLQGALEPAKLAEQV